MDKSKKFIIIRHGTTENNEKDKIRGWLDLPLSEEGIKEGHVTSKHVAKHDLDGMVSSDLLRARQTADIISKDTGIPILEHNYGFRPWNLGELTGMDVKATLSTIKKYAEETPDKPIPGGGESFNEFKDRFLNALKDVFAHYKGKKLGIVAHHRSERLIDSLKPDGTVDFSKFSTKGISPSDVMEHDVDKVTGLK